jgi:lysophospholipase L1-like esterase
LRSPLPDTRRVILLGASETFGLYEPPNKEFAAQLADLTRQDKIEIVNAALPGITVATLAQYWRTWVSGFSASTVIIYPSIHLYLSCEDWHAAAGQTQSASQDLHSFDIEDLRLFGRLKNVVAQPESIVEWRNARKVALSVSQHPRTWLYTTPPRTCLARLQSDLLQLIDEIQRSGANVIVCTQALRASRVPGPADLRDLESFRVFSPRVPARIAREFVSIANNNILKLPELRNVRVVDVDSALGGQRWAFEDLVHLNEQGSRALATLLRDSLVSHPDSVRAGQK